MSIDKEILDSFESVDNHADELCAMIEDTESLLSDQLKSLRDIAREIKELKGKVEGLIEKKNLAEHKIRMFESGMSIELIEEFEN